MQTLDGGGDMDDIDSREQQQTRGGKKMLTMLKKEEKQYRQQAAACCDAKTARYYAEKARKTAVAIAQIEAEYFAVIMEGGNK